MTRIGNFIVKTRKNALTIGEDVMVIAIAWTNLTRKIAVRVKCHICKSLQYCFSDLFFTVECQYWQFKCVTSGICIHNRRKCNGEVSERLLDFA